MNWQCSTPKTLLEKPTPSHGTQPAGARLGQEAAELLLEASRDPQGCVIRVRDLSGVHVKTNRRSFVDKDNARSRAIWEGAVDELASKALIKDVDHDGEIYELTRDGYDLAQLLSKNQ
jgi:hypothetical protein